MSANTSWCRVARAFQLGTLAWIAVWVLGAPGVRSADAAPEAGTLRVGTSGDYAPFSFTESDESLAGFDVAVARRFAEDEDLELELVRFSWPGLLADLRANRFDVAMGGVTVTPERSVAGRFSAPVATSGAMALVQEDSAYRSVEDLGLPGTRLVVNAGGHLERVARATFPRATLIALSDNDAVLGPLLEGKVDAAISDDREAPLWQESAPELRALGPFSRDLKAYLVGANQAALADRLDAWLFAREQDGTLAELRAEHLGSREQTATPLFALFVAMNERLNLMPLVAEAKRGDGQAVRVPEREAVVLEAAVERTRAAAQRAGVTPIPDRWVRRLFQNQIDVGVAIQQSVLAGSDSGNPSPDLETELRPALLRLGERIADALVRLQGPLDPGYVEAFARERLEAPGLTSRHIDLLADTVAQISRYRTD
jgi:cyclohexadienyl dehydratase